MSQKVHSNLDKNWCGKYDFTGGIKGLDTTELFNAMQDQDNKK